MSPSNLSPIYTKRRKRSNLISFQAFFLIHASLTILNMVVSKLCTVHFDALQLTKNCIASLYKVLKQQNQQGLFYISTQFPSPLLALF